MTTKIALVSEVRVAPVSGLLRQARIPAMLMSLRWGGRQRVVVRGRRKAFLLGRPFVEWHLPFRMPFGHAARETVEAWQAFPAKDAPFLPSFVSVP